MELKKEVLLQYDFKAYRNNVYARGPSVEMKGKLKIVIQETYLL
jgi:hypothetical protein